MLLRNMLRFIGIVQIILGTAFTVFPSQFIATMNLSATPEWVYWLFAQMGVRFWAFGIGMFIAARNPERHQSWIGLMIGIQVVDWVTTLFYLGTGAVTLAQVTSAAFLPILFIAVLGWRFPRQQKALTQ